MQDPPSGKLIAGKYQLERALARGGMGSVWVARDTSLDRNVAVKFMDPALVQSGDARMRFEREAKAAAQLSSSHVVQVFDYGIDDGAPFLVMELMAGEALSAKLKREKRLSIRDTAMILAPVCKALQQAHDAGIVHRDLKPANLFIAVNGDDEVVKILDFGIAKSQGMGEAGDTTKTGALLGSPQYMSPEQVRAAKSVNHQSDLWSLGVIAYRALTGRIPFKGEELGDVLVRICSDPVVPPSTLVPELPPAIDAFFVRALARDLGERFQSAREMSATFVAIAESDGAGRASMPQWGPISMSSSALSPFAPSVPPSVRAPAAGPPSVTPPSMDSIPPAAAMTTAPAQTLLAGGDASHDAPGERPARSALVWVAAAAAIGIVAGATIYLLGPGSAPAVVAPQAAAEVVVAPAAAPAQPAPVEPVVTQGGAPAEAAPAEPAAVVPAATAPAPKPVAAAKTAAPVATPKPTAVPAPAATPKKNPLDIELK